MNLIKPSLQLKNIYEIDFDYLKNLGIQHMIFDLDNTLVPETSEKPNEQLINWFEKLEENGFTKSIVSNNTKQRVERFVEGINIYAIPEAQKPDTECIERVMRSLNAKPENTVMVGDRLLTDILVGNKMKLMTILVEPMGEDLSKMVKWMRKLEKVLLTF